MRSQASASRATRSYFTLVAMKALRQPGIDGIDKGRERLRVGAGERFSEPMQRASVERGQTVELIERALAQRQGVLVEEGERARDAALCRGSGGLDLWIA